MPKIGTGSEEGSLATFLPFSRFSASAFVLLVCTVYNVYPIFKNSGIIKLSYVCEMHLCLICILIKYDPITDIHLDII